LAKGLGDSQKQPIQELNLQDSMPATTVRDIIAARLKTTRIKAGYASAEDFCEKNKLKLQEYQQHEKGHARLKISQAQRYCCLLKISLQELMVGKLK
jgi:hypothetical protein